MRSIEGFDWTDSLARVAKVPRLVIHGARDNTPLAGNREWVAHQPNARLLVVEGAGHWPHYERPDVTWLPSSGSSREVGRPGASRFPETAA